MTKAVTPTGQNDIFQRFLRIARPFFIILGAVILLILVRKIGWSNFAFIVTHLAPGYILLAILAWLMNLMVAAQRCKSLAAPHLKYFRVFEVVLVSYLLNYGSAVQGVGIGARVGLLKGEQVAVARSLAGTGAEVIFDLIFTVSVTMIFAMESGFGKARLGEIHSWPFIMGALVGLGVLFVIFYLSRRGGFWGRFTEGLKEAMALRRFALNLLYTAAIWILAAASFYFILRAAGAHFNPLWTPAALAVGFVFGLVSLVPGGLGVRDVSWVYVLSLGGVPLKTSGTAALFMRFLYIATVALLVFIIGLMRRRLEERERNGRSV